MLLLQGQKNLSRFSHTRLSSGVFLSVCHRDGWLAASARLENLLKAEDAHIQSSCRVFEHIVLSDGRCDWICLSCGAVVLSTSDEAELAEAEKSHRCLP